MAFRSVLLLFCALASVQAFLPGRQLPGERAAGAGTRGGMQGLRVTPKGCSRGRSWLRGSARTQHLMATTLELTGKSEEELIALAREFFETGTGFHSVQRDEMFAPDFVFRGPVIGPLNFKDYTMVLDGSGVYKAFPDMQTNSFGYSIDPTEPNRVWFMYRYTGTHTGRLFEKSPLLPTISPTGNPLKCGLEACSILFNENAKVRLLTPGNVVDRDPPQDTTHGGNGLLFGILASLGLNVSPVLATKYTGGLTRVLVKIAGGGPLPMSDFKDVPQWYKDYRPWREMTQGYR